MAIAEPTTTTIFDRAICLSVELRKPSNRRAGDLTKVTTDADPEMLGLSKRLFDSDEFQRIGRIDSETRRYLKKRCLPSPLRAGIYLVPIPLVEQVDARLRHYFALRAEAIEGFLLTYPQSIDEARDRLNSQFDQSDYPDIEQLRAAFSAHSQYLTFGVPEQLASLNSDLFDRAKEEAAARWTEAADQIQLALRQAMQELVAHMVDRLTPGEDGKKKLFMSSTLENVTDFLETFKARNITDDHELESLVTQAQAVLAGADVDAIRKNENFRAELREQFAQVQESLDRMVTVAPSRKFYFDEGDQS